MGHSLMWNSPSPDGTCSMTYYETKLSFIEPPFEKLQRTHICISKFNFSLTKEPERTLRIYLVFRKDTIEVLYLNVLHIKFCLV